MLHFEYSQIQSKWLASVTWWGRDTGAGAPLPNYSTIGPLPFEDFKAAFLASYDPAFANDILSSGEAIDAASLDALLQTMLLQVQQLAFEPANLFQLEPNKFLEDPLDKFRILYRKEL